MLNKVPTGMNALTRNVVINHPNTFYIELYKKKILRKDANEVPGEVAGDPTWGGMGQLDDADEEDYEYEYAGDGYALPAEGFSPAPMVDHNDANIGPVDEFRFVIVPKVATYGEEGYFDVSTHDIVMIPIGSGDEWARLAFEVVGRETINNIPPFSVRYVCNRRDDLHTDIHGNFINQKALKAAQREYQASLVKNSEK